MTAPLVAPLARTGPQPEPIPDNAALLAEHEAGATFRGLAAKYDRSTGTITKRLSRGRRDRKAAAPIAVVEGDKLVHRDRASAETIRAIIPAAPKRKGPPALNADGTPYPGRVGILRGWLDDDGETFASWLTNRSKIGSRRDAFGGARAPATILAERLERDEGLSPREAHDAAIEQLRVNPQLALALEREDEEAFFATRR
jgi:hypothetical protein